MEDWNDEKATQFCLSKLASKDADMFIDTPEVLNIYTRRHCRNFHLRTNIRFIESAYTFMMRGEDHEFQANLSVALIHLRQQPEYREMVRRHFGLGMAEECSLTRNNDDEIAVPVSAMKGT